MPAVACRHAELHRAEAGLRASQEGDAMTDKLTGRALDEACARAMGLCPREGKTLQNRGHLIGDRWRCDWATDPINRSAPADRKMPQFLSDPATIPEMLACLTAGGFEVG